MTREEWLLRLAALLHSEIMAPAGYAHQVAAARPLLDGLRVSISWPSRGALSKRNRTIGQCWAHQSSADNTTEIFISPVLGTGFDAAHVLLHELIHAAVGTKAGHNPTFQAAARKLGLEGKPTATVPGAALTERINALLSQLPPYPHAKLDHTALDKKKQSTRMLKASCIEPECESQEDGGFTVRITRKWADRYALTCPACNSELEIQTGEN